MISRIVNLNEVVSVRLQNNAYSVTVQLLTTITSPVNRTTNIQVAPDVTYVVVAASREHENTIHGHVENMLRT